jgi:tetratricopeptide (TPR) repeat protein
VPVTVRETAETLVQQASMLRQAGRVPEAISAYRRLLALRPDLAESWYNLAWLQHRARDFHGALASYREALQRGAAEPEEIHLNRAVILADHLARGDAAEVELNAALELNPRYLPALLNLGNLNEDLGRREAAQAAYERVLAIDPSNMLALSRLAGVARISGADDPLVERLRQGVARPGGSDADKADLGFSLGRALDSVGAYDEAFAAYAAANRQRRESFGAAFPGYDPQAQEHLVDRLIHAFPKPAEAAPGPAARAPIFICGMFRSGSTLAEQILAGHSKVTAGGELDLLPRLVESALQPYPEAAAAAPPEQIERLRAAYLNGLAALHPGAGLVTDKRPDNFLHIGLIKTLFPDARIVHTRRDPLDNCLSVYFLDLDPAMAYALDLADTAHFHGQHRRLMRHWKSLYPDDIFELDYDGLVADPKPAIRALLDFCGLPWEEACLSFHAAANVVKTASVWQVRQPLYRHASGRWRNYQAHLAPLAEALARDSDEAQ